LNQVSFIGSASLKDIIEQQKAERIGESIAKAGFHLVCGGMGGAMEYACKGFKEAKTPLKTIGILPSNNANEANSWIDIFIPTGLDIGRNQLVVSSGFVTVAFAGGAGTLSEIAMASQLGKPVILIKGSGGWTDRLNSTFIDSRENSRLYHLENIDNLQPLLEKISKEPSKPYIINNGHNR
jgi:uncharacterized protein (TIGR00725 family)